MGAEKAGEGVMAPSQPVDSWVQCDRCNKWRRIPTEAAQRLADDAPWYCEMNEGSIYNDCDVPQELTDQQIDHLHEEEEGAGGGGGGAGGGGEKVSGQKLRKRPPVWQIIKHNIYTHRARKEQDEDDIMICQCPRLWGPPDPNVTGCGPNCLNRMLNIECVTEFCPCGERCSNQMFTRREYAPLEVKRAGAKGFGLFTSKPLKAGDFIIEYIGEVLEEEEYLRRKEFYIQTGQRHYYFMNVGNGEVIDACRKGHLGRFINHSCDPNCETQKWLVHGELAIGLFAVRDVEAGEELTFDYNFERYGDKPMKCLCGAKSCRGIIGGTQEGAQPGREVVVPVGAEDEPEPIMVTEAEEDRALAAILDRVVGLGWDKGWNASMQRRLTALATAHGLSLDALSESESEGEGEEEEEEGRGGSGDEEISDMSSEEGRRSEAGEVSGGSAPVPTTSSGRKAAAAGRSPAQRPGSAASGKAAAAARRRQQQQQQQREKAAARRRGPAAEDEEGEEDEEGGDEQGAEAAWEEAQAAAALAAKLHVAGSKKQRILAANQAAKAAALASQQLPFRRRLKKLARAVAAEQQQQQQQQPVGSAAGGGVDRGPAAPATSTASQRSGPAGAQQQRAGSKQLAGDRGGAASQSIASTSTALAAAGGGATAATTTPLIPRRASAHLAGTPATDKSGLRPRRRSEIDRRLDEMVGPSGRLRDTSLASVIRFLRLFNLCDIGHVISKEEQAARHAERRQQQQQQHQQQQAAAGERDGGGREGRDGGLPSRPPSRADSGSNPAAAAAMQQQQQGEQGEVPMEEAQQPAERAEQAQQALPESPGQGREEGEVTPERSEEGNGAAAAPQPPPLQPLPPVEQQQQPPQQPPQQRQRSMSPSRDRDRGPRDPDDAGGIGRSRGGGGRDDRRELSPRQRARLADMSLLLDVVLKHTAANTKATFVQCGILRQLLATIGHNVGPQYGVILRKVFRVVEALPFDAELMHTTRSAHGSFADLLRELSQHQDYEVRTRALGLMRQYHIGSGGGGGQHGPGARGRQWGGDRQQQWERDRREGELGPPSVRSPAYRGGSALPPPPEPGPGLGLSPTYQGSLGRSPHRDSLPHPPSRLGMHRGPAGSGPPREREPSYFEGRGHYGAGGRSPYGPPGPDLPPLRHQHWGSYHQQSSRGYPGGPPPPGPPPRGHHPRDRDRDRDRDREGPGPHPHPQPPPPLQQPSRRGSASGEVPPPAQPQPLPSPLDARAAAESIAAALMGAAAAAGEGGDAGQREQPHSSPEKPRLETVAGQRRKRSRWEPEGDDAAGAGPAEEAAPAPAPQPPSSDAAGAAASNSLLPPGFGGAAARPNSPPPRPPSVLGTTNPAAASPGGEEEEGVVDDEAPPSKRPATGQGVVPTAVRPSSSGGSGRGSPAAAAAASGGSAEERGVAGDDGEVGTPMELGSSLTSEQGGACEEAAAAAARAASQAHPGPGEGSAPRSGRRHSRWGSPVDVAPTPAPAAAAATSSGGGAAGARPRSPVHEAAGAVGAGPSPGAREQEGGPAASLLPVPSLPLPLPSASGQRLGLPRPASATFSDVSRGDSGSSGHPHQQQQLSHHVPVTVPSFLATAAASTRGGGAPANGGLHSSLTTNGLPGSAQAPHWESSEAAAQPPYLQQQQPAAESPPAGDLSFFLRAAVTVQDEWWDEPSPQFEQFVGEVVRVRIGKYCQPDHPARLDWDHAMQLYHKVSGQVVSKEHEAYEERQRSGLHKPILRAKLVDKIKEFVSGSVRRIKQLPPAPGAAAAGGGDWA